VAAGRLADKGHRVTIVEADLVGGECSYCACMPSKALLRPAQALSEARRVPGAAEPVTGSLDVAAVLSRRDMIVGHRRCSVVDALQRTRSRIGPRCDALKRLRVAGVERGAGV
jgi:pyruvate/2-oxoglutarate dehydrogenase complex dihydrolipoamide dehydrogenase (E3) component